MKFSNPIIPGFHPDPSFCRAGEDYYLVTSSFEFFPGVPIYHSRDLVNWTQIGHVFDRDSQLPLQKVRPSNGVFAPTIRYHDGTFFVITTNVGSTGNLIVHATDPAGPWSEPALVDQGGIDPSLFFDEDGKVYYTGTLSGPEFVQGIALFEVDPFTGKKLSEPKLIWCGTGGRYPEAPHIYKINGLYYLMIAEGGTEYGHMVTIARAQDIYGPYESCPHNPILTHARLAAQYNPIMGTGHADLLEAHDGSWWLTFLAFRPSESYFHHLGRETFLSPVGWKDGWPVVNEGRPVELQMDCPTLPACPVKPLPVRDDFSRGIGFAWNYLRNPRGECYAAGADGLTLTGCEDTLDSGYTPTFLGRRQEQFDMRCAARLAPLSPQGDGRCGLSVFYNYQHHYDLCLEGGKLCLIKQVGDMRVTAFETPWAGECELEIRADRFTYSFYFAQPGGEKRLAGRALTRFVSTEATPSSFTGVYLAMFAERGARARFAWFDYENL